MAEIYIFSEDDKLLTTLAETNVLISAPLRDELNQVASTPFFFIVEAEAQEGEVVPASFIEEENRVVIRDREGRLREYIIKEIDDVSNYDGPKVRATCIPSFLDELSTRIIEDRRIFDKTAKEAMDVALEGSRFKAVAGELGINSISFYYKTSVDAIWEIRNRWGGDILDVVHLSEDGTHIEAREIHLVERLGADRGLRFDAEHNAKEIERTVLSYPVTAMYGRGASLEIFDEDGEATGGFTRFIDFADVEWKVSEGHPADKPLGQKWVGDPEALMTYGIKTKNGPIHKTAIFSNQDYETPEELIWATWQHLQDNKDPKVNYKVKASELNKPAHLGDTAVAVDRNFARPIEIQTRIIAVEYDLVDIENTLKVEMGDFLRLDDGMKDELEEIKKTVNKPKPDRPIDNGSFPDVKPGVPSNFTAIGAFSKVILSWAYEMNVGISHYELYASEVRNFNPQPQHMIWRGKAGGYIHESTVNKNWYYRLRAVNFHGTASDFTAQITAETLQINADTEISEYSITKHLLAQEAIIESIHIGEATVKDIHISGRISSGKLIVDRETQFGDGYNPADKEGKKVRGKTPPADKSLIWIDTSDPSNDIWRVWDPVKSAWVATRFEVGGRNLARGTGTLAFTGYGTGTSIEVLEGSPTSVVWVGITGSNPQGLVQDAPYRDKMVLEKDGEYILSFDVRGTVEDLNYIYIMNNPSPNQSIGTVEVPSSSEFNKVELKFTPRNDAPSSYIMISTQNKAVGQWFEVKNIKLEKGNVATDWTPAPEDVEDIIDDARRDLGDQINTVTEEYQSAIDLAVDGITLAVEQKIIDSENHITETLTSRIDTAVGEVNINFNQLTERLDEAGDQLEEINSYFRFTGQGLNIGKSNSPLNINISNEQIDFMDNGQSAAHINKQNMYIRNLEVLSSMRVGVHKIEKFNSDITLIKWVGENSGS